MARCQVANCSSESALRTPASTLLVLLRTVARWLITNANGLLISCATPATSSPSDASFAD